MICTRSDIIIEVNNIQDGSIRIEWLHFLGILNINNIINLMGKHVLLSFFLIFIASAIAEIDQLQCGCLNGGICNAPVSDPICTCPPEFVGKHCEFITNTISNSSVLADLSENYTFFSFVPNQSNYYRFTFEICMAHNPEELENLIYLEVQKEDGSINGQPTFFSSSKIKIKEGECLTYGTQYIEIKLVEGQPSPKIVFGIKALKKSFKNFFFKTIPGQHHREIPNKQNLAQIDRQQSEEAFSQRLFFNANYQLYEETMAQRILRSIIKFLLFVLCFLFVFIFGKLTMYSYEIEARDILLFLQKILRIVCRKICPVQHAKSFRNYRMLKMQDQVDLNDAQNEECAICLQSFDEDELIRETVCGHIYHQTCLDGWSIKNDTCPLCRQSLKAKNKNWLINFLQG